MSRTALLACLLASSLYADEPIVGTWRTDPLKSTTTSKWDSFEIKDGMYRCRAFTPTVEIKADGMKHPDSTQEGSFMSVKVLDDRTVEYAYFMGDRRISAWKETVSADGQHRSREQVLESPNGTKVTQKISWERTGAAAPGAHALSGTWGKRTDVEVSDAGREYTYKTVPGGLLVTDPTGTSFQVRLDGKRSPVSGADGIDQVEMRKIAARVYEEKYWFRGKLVDTNRLTVSDDGKTLNVAWSAESASGTDVATRK